MQVYQIQRFRFHDLLIGRDFLYLKRQLWHRTIVLNNITSNSYSPSLMRKYILYSIHDIILSGTFWLLIMKLSNMANEIHVISRCFGRIISVNWHRNRQMTTIPLAPVCQVNGSLTTKRKLFNVVYYEIDRFWSHMSLELGVQWIYCISVSVRTLMTPSRAVIEEQSTIQSWNRLLLLQRPKCIYV